MSIRDFFTKRVFNRPKRLRDSIIPGGLTRIYEDWSGSYVHTRHEPTTECPTERVRSIQQYVRIDEKEVHLWATYNGRKGNEVLTRILNGCLDINAVRSDVLRFMDKSYE